MNIEETFIKDLVVVNPAVFPDERGYFLKPTIRGNLMKKEFTTILSKTINLSPNVGDSRFAFAKSILSRKQSW